MSQPQAADQFRLALVEDHILQRRRTEELVESQSEFSLVFSGNSLAEFRSWLIECPLSRRPHVILLDLMVDRGARVEASDVEVLLRQGFRIVVVSALASPALIRQIMKAGVHAVVSKQDSEDDLLAAIRCCLAGEEWTSSEVAAVIAGDPDRPKLSIQEERAFTLYASGLTIAQVAGAMNIQPDTAKQYVDRVKQKYIASGIEARTQLDLARIAWSEGIVDPTTAPR